MKQKTIQVEVLFPAKSNREMLTVNAVVIDSCGLAIHKNVNITTEGVVSYPTGAGYTVAHVATGRALLRLKKLEDAKIDLDRLKAVNVNWKSKDFDLIANLPADIQQQLKDIRDRVFRM